jgi:hypothetical protein
MFQGVVVAQGVAQGLLELGQRQKEPIVGGSPPQHPPEALDDLELWMIAGQARELQMRELLARLSDEGPVMPRGVVDHEHHAGMFGRGISSGDIPQVPRKALWQAPWPRPGLLQLRWHPGPLHQASGQPASHEVERPEDVHRGVAIQGAHHRPVPYEPYSDATKESGVLKPQSCRT